jgi:hypothetical protein
VTLTTAQLQTLKAHIAANTDTIGGTAVKDLPATADNNFAIAATATGGGGDLTLDNVSIASSQTVTISTYSLTAGNA